LATNGDTFLGAKKDFDNAALIDYLAPIDVPERERHRTAHRSVALQRP